MNWTWSDHGTCGVARLGDLSLVVAWGDGASDYAYAFWRWGNSEREAVWGVA
jgi:hypothetical protein